MKLFCVVLFLCVLAFPAAAIDREAFTFTQYDLDVRIDPAQQRLGVRGKISLRNDSKAPQKTAVLQISSTLDWRSIKLGGKPLEFTSNAYASDIDHTGAVAEATVTLPQEVLPHQIIELGVGYEGVIPLDATRLTRIGVPEAAAKHADWDQIGKSFSVVRGAGYVTWYPVAIEGVSLSESDSVSGALGRWAVKEKDANLRIQFTSDAEAATLQLVCNGHQEKSESGAMRCDYSPLQAAIPTFLIANYATLGAPPLTVAYLPGQEDAAQTFLDTASESARSCRQWATIRQIFAFSRLPIPMPRRCHPGHAAHPPEIADDQRSRVEPCLCQSAPDGEIAVAVDSGGIGPLRSSGVHRAAERTASSTRVHGRSRIRIS